MRSLWTVGLGTILAVTLWVPKSYADLNSHHDDYRNTPKALLELNFRDDSASSGEELSRTFLTVHREDFQIESLDQLVLSRVSHSLLGDHYVYQQQNNGIAVEGGQVIVSVRNDGSSVYRAFNNYYPRRGQLISAAVKLSADQALEIAWADLKVHGRLLAVPTADLVYRVSDTGRFVLGYATMTEVEAPAGAWEHFIDASSGSVLLRQDTMVERIKRPRPEAIDSYQGPVLDRVATVASFHAQAEKAAELRSEDVQTVDGHGLVFDPDPRTSLMDPELKDDSPAAMFEAAYFDRDLLGVTLSNGVYELRGPWVAIADFESPAVPPATSSTGAWMAKRGNVAFNDAMTYFHIDQSQRYMQSLGFVDSRGIQRLQIQVDANGVSGSDNSHYSPSNNRLAFGHGCVDDNEDADVILHEYGHAIHFGINPNWRGGDTGAMGEGFGDYWAGSYSLSTANGANFQTNTMFNWDGTPCWAGRTLEATGAIYDPSRTYEAHRNIEGGYQSDELWSTPIFQTLRTLVAGGTPRREVDMIVLEAQFGLGQGIKMPDMARSIVATSAELFPGGPHGQVFRQEFERHRILMASGE